MVCTDEFLALGKLECRSRGIADLPFAITKHPLGGLAPADVLAKAEALLPEVVSAVSAPALVAAASREHA